MLDDIIRELDLDPADPQVDQYRAAIQQVSSIADKFAKVRIPDTPAPVVLRLDRDVIPPPIRGWLELYAADVDDGVSRCEHGSWFTPTTLYAAEPNRALCPKCDGQRGAELASRSVSSLLMDCDFCGVPHNVFELRVVAIPLVTILVRGVACGQCLAEP